jgi:16S rRNA (cytosine1402-N4)-methyltransferase
MRFDPSRPEQETAAHILATRDAAELAALFRSYGEERFASRIARTVVARRREAPLETTSDLLHSIEMALPANRRWRAARHAARVFQALRIAVNDELAAVRDALPQAVAELAPRGRLVVISFHSLEDRLVKGFFRSERDAGRLRILTKRPLQPSAGEIAANRRAASAKLRAGERTEF